MQRVEQKQVDDLIEANKQSIQTTPAPATEESKYEKVAEQASFDDFMKIDMPRRQSIELRSRRRQHQNF